jgi:hypothetical protein
MRPSSSTIVVGYVMMIPKTSSKERAMNWVGAISIAAGAMVQSCALQGVRRAR